MHHPLPQTHPPHAEIREITGVWNAPFILLAGIGAFVLCSITTPVLLLVDFNSQPLRSVVALSGLVTIDAAYVAVVLILYRRLHARRLMIDTQGFQITGLTGKIRTVRWDEVTDVRILYSFLDSRRILAGYRVTLQDGSVIAVPRYGRSAGQVYLELVGGTIRDGMRGLTDQLKTERVVNIGEIQIGIADLKVGHRLIAIDDIIEIKSKMPGEPEVRLKIKGSSLPVTLDLYDASQRQTVPQAYLLPVLLRALWAARQPELDGNHHV